MTNLETIKQAVIQAVPEIMELKFGCEVECTSPKLRAEYDLVGKGICTDICVLWNVQAHHISGHRRVDFQLILGEPQYFTILGRHITLEDVLRAIGLTSNDNFKINSPYGNIALMDYREKDGFYHHAYWELGKPLEDQLEECLAFLAGVFKK